MIAKSNSASDRPEIEPTTPGVYPSVCYGVIGIGTHNTGFKNPKTGKDNYANQVVLLFELPTERIDINGKDVPRSISTFPLTISLGQKANLRTRYLEPWRGKKFTDAEAAEGFDMQVLLGQNCLMSVINVEVGEKTYANIGAVMPMQRGAVTFEPENEVIYYEIDAGMVIPETTPEWLKIKIFESVEMRGHSKDDETGQQEYSPEDAMRSEKVAEQTMDDDAPF